jgi:polyvinyl alcohol dehydrogenase (cytochrome)
MSRPRFLPVALLVVLFVASCGDDSSPADPAATARVPCAVAEVLERRCTECHGNPLREGAPRHLLTSSDFAIERGTSTVGDLAAERIRDSTRPMPPSGLPHGDELELLSDWLDHGARGDAHGCEVETPARDAGSSRDAGARPAIGPREIVPTDWPTFGGDLGSTRANLEDHAISRDNVASLVRAWELPTAWTSSTPLVKDGVAYLPTWGAELHAVRVADGQELWRVQLPALVDSSAGASDDRLFISDSKGFVHALDLSTGKLLWSQKLDEHPFVHLWSSPIYIPEQDLVVVGTSSYEEVTGVDPLTFRGSLVALDAEDGHERWRFRTTPNDTDGTGVAIWATASVDAERELLYIGTGNNYAAPGSELSDSLVAIDVATGTKVWSHQFLADDVFSIVFAPGPDYDIGSTATLFTAGGRDLAGIGIKSGLFAALDRDTGELVWTTQVAPGGFFGGIISASAFAEGSLFVAANDETTGEVVNAALDAQSGDVLWQHRLPGQTFSGVAYANGLVYFATMKGTLVAYEAASGDELWRDTLPDAAASPIIADGTLLIPYGYILTLAADSTSPAQGGLIAYTPQ